MSGFLNKAKDAIAGHKDKAEEGIDKAGDVLDEKTDGKHSEKIDTAQEKAKSALDNLGN